MQNAYIPVVYIYAKCLYFRCLHRLTFSHFVSMSRSDFSSIHNLFVKGKDNDCSKRNHANITKHDFIPKSSGNCAAQHRANAVADIRSNKISA